MGRTNGVDITKQDDSNASLPNQKPDITNWHNEILKICQSLSVPANLFNKEEVYIETAKYIKNRKRWLYSVVSGYLFNCDDSIVNTFIANLDSLQDYANEQFEKSSAAETERMLTAIDKLWDHANLAQKQNIVLKNDSDNIKSQFDEYIEPFKADFSHEMNKQFVSLIAIFTALSFIVFGGISSLSSILSGLGHVSIIELMILGCIWGLCILNLVFTFIYFVAKLTKIPIKTSESEGASLSDRYPLVFWSNFALLFILVTTSFIYFIDYSNSGHCLIEFSQDHPVISMVGGFLLIVLAFGTVGVCVLKGRKTKAGKSKVKTVDKQQE